MNDHMTKPIDPEVLAAKLLQWIAPYRRSPAENSNQTSAPREQSPGLTFLDGIDGFDPRLGLHLAMGREKLYLSLLHKFVQGERDWLSRMNEALDHSDTDTAKRLAHTLKGVSAQVGALRMRDLAQLLEHAIEQRAPAQTLGPLLREAGDHLVMLIQALGKRIPAGETAPTSTGGNANSLSELCRQLVNHFEHDDFASGQLVANNEGLLRTALGIDYDSFANAVDDFDFVTAMDKLKVAVANQGITL